MNYTVINDNLSAKFSNSCKHTARMFSLWIKNSLKCSWLQLLFEGFNRMVAGLQCSGTAVLSTGFSNYLCYYKFYIKNSNRSDGQSCIFGFALWGCWNFFTLLRFTVLFMNKHFELYFESCQNTLQVVYHMLGFFSLSFSL